MKKTTAVFDSSAYAAAGLKSPRGASGFFFKCNDKIYQSDKGLTYMESQQRAKVYFQRLFPTQSYFIITVHP
jgi:hypothetical protein